MAAPDPAHATGFLGGWRPLGTAVDGALTIAVDAEGRITISTADGTALVVLDGYRIAAGIDASGGTVQTEDDGTIRIQHDVTDGDYTAASAYRVDGAAVTVSWEFTGPPDAVFEDGRIYRTLVGADAPEGSPIPAEVHFPATRWLRDSRGGVPYRERLTELYFASWSAVHGAFVIPGSSYPRRGDGSLHTPPTLGDDGIWRASYVFRADEAVADARTRFVASSQIAAGAVLSAPALAVDVSHPSTYNIFSAPGPQTFTLSAYSRAARSVSLAWTVRDFDGAVVSQGTRSTQLAASSVADLELDVDLSQSNGVYFLEVTGDAGDDTAFARTTAAVLPPHSFRPNAEDSITGLGGFSRVRAEGASQAVGNEPAADEVALWQRLGIRWLRNNWLSAQQAEELGIRTAYQPGGSPEQFTGDPDGFRAWLANALRLGDLAGVSHYELLNEWNHLGGLGAAQWAQEYTENWLLPFRAELDRTGSTAKLNSMGLVSWDAAFMDALRSFGGWDALDGVAMHPGRGNFTVDYDPTDVSDAGQTGTVWNFFRSVREARAYLDEHGPEKELWLTETYAKTAPNSWWSDDDRSAADSVMLTFALSKAIGVTGLHWFQLYDGVWNDKYGVDYRDGEYHYGVFHADRSPKPSALAFATAAETFDDSRFLGWLESPHPDLHGLRFENTHGTFWMLWSRQDGFVTNVPHEDDAGGFFATPEPWVSTAQGSLSVDIPSDGVLVARDVIGRTHDLMPVSGGHRVTVTASPLIVSGDLDSSVRAPAAVEGAASIALSDVTVTRDESGLVVRGMNDSGSTLQLRVEPRPTAVVTADAPAGSFEVVLSSTADSGTQVRIFVERADGAQTYRAQYYRTV
jgi:hypothetical protein